MKVILLASITILLTGCTYTTECPENKALFGYTEQKVDDSNYRVKFKSTTSDAEDASNFALLRAAKLTQTQGYDWFEVTDKEVFVNPQLDECGSISKSKTLKIEDLPTRSSNEIFTLIGIKMGRGIKSNATGYDAQGVINNLASKTE